MEFHLSYLQLTPIQPNDLLWHLLQPVYVVRLYTARKALQGHHLRQPLQLTS
nr:MAG TPA: hypothetical protein [Crassvirales sp.]